MSTRLCSFNIRITAVYAFYCFSVYVCTLASTSKEGGLCKRQVERDSCWLDYSDSAVEKRPVGVILHPFLLLLFTEYLGSSSWIYTQLATFWVGLSSGGFAPSSFIYGCRSELSGPQSQYSLWHDAVQRIVSRFEIDIPSFNEKPAHCSLWTILITCRTGSIDLICSAFLEVSLLHLMWAFSYNLPIRDVLLLQIFMM